MPRARSDPRPGPAHRRRRVRASTTCSIGTARARRSSSTSRTTATSIRSTPRSSRPPPSGSGWPSRNSRWRPARASSRTCGPSARTTSSTTTTACTSTSGTGRRSSAPDERNLDFLRNTVQAIWRVLRAAEAKVQTRFPQLRTDRYPDLPEHITFLHAEEILERYPNAPAQAARDAHPPGLPGGLHHRHRLDARRRLSARDAGRRLRRLGQRDCLLRRTPDARAQRRHPRLEPGHRRRHELSSMGIRVNAETLRRQLEITGQLDWLSLPYHRGIVSGELPLSIGGGIGQSRTQMLLAQEGTPRRGERHGLATGPQGHVRRPRHPRHRMTPTTEAAQARAVTPTARAAVSPRRRVGDRPKRPPASHRSALPNGRRHD